MLFNTINFVYFLLPVYFLFWKIKSVKSQNLFLLLSSYFFYSCWDWRFLFLLLFSTFLDYYSAIKIEESIHKKFWFVLSISANLLFLGFFKYFNFFIDSFNQFLLGFGVKSNIQILNIILPVGISFYTFHGLSYVIDVYKKKITAEKNMIDYGLFVSYFPLLVAGPIERTTHLLPQLKIIKKFDYQKSIDGLKQLLWGCFKKVVIADQCSLIVDFIFVDHESFHGLSHLLGALMFTVQIYCDFSGYTDMALGISRLFGIELLQNFHFPYFSKSIKEFWSKWHISLSSWFRDYVYIPLGGNKVSYLKRFRNVMITFVLSGFWHGANWTFLVWGCLHGFFTFFHFSYDFKGPKYIRSIVDGFKILNTFLIVSLAWIFFRSDSVIDSISFIEVIFSDFSSNASVNEFISICNNNSLLIITIILFFTIEYMSRNKVYGLQTFDLLPKFLKIPIYYFVIFLIIIYSGNDQQFIYFQF